MNTNQFSDLGISAPILKSIQEMGFELPTKIQTAAIPKIMEGHDVAGQAQTGTGKTASFAIPVLEGIDTKSKNVQAIVMCPTRELAIQVTGEFIKLSRFMGGVQVTPVYGGQPIQRQIKQIKAGTQIVVGTPGRVIDHLKRGTLNLDSLKFVVLDEADEMLNMGFRDDIEMILGFSSQDSPKQTIMFSATMSSEIKKIMKRWFKNPEMIRVEGKAQSADGVEHFIVEARDSMRTEGICRLLDLSDYRLALVFCNTKRKCDSLVSEMQSRGYSSDALHGDMSQNVRDKVMNKFRRGQVDVLIATDVAARGLDVDDVDVVFNYDIPQDPEYYVHRIGRTGRAGRKGTAYTFSSGRKSKNIRYIEKMLKTKIKTIPLPSVKEVEDSVMDAFLDDVKKTLEAGGLRPYIEQIEALAADRFTPIEVAAALLRMREGAKASVSSSGRRKSQGAKTPREKSPRAENERDAKPERKSRAKSGGKPKKSKEDEPFYSHFVNKNRGKKTKKRSRKSG
jgi:ATP-dependent RNA helicase DeaD